MRANNLDERAALPQPLKSLQDDCNLAQVPYWTELTFSSPPAVSFSKPRLAFVCLRSVNAYHYRLCSPGRTCILPRLRTRCAAGGQVLVLRGSADRFLQAPFSRSVLARQAQSYASIDVHFVCVWCVLVAACVCV